MSKDSYYFKHDQDVSQDLKIIALEKKYGYAGSGLYWRMVELMRASSDYCLTYDAITFEGVAKKEFDSSDSVRAFVDFCISLRLLSKNGESIYSERLNRDMDKLDDVRKKRSKAGKKSAEVRWGTDTIEMDDPMLAALVSDYEEISGRMINGINEQESLKDLLDTYGYDEIKQAFKDNKGKPVNYIEKVLDGRSRESRGNSETSASERKRAVDKPLR